MPRWAHDFVPPALIRPVATPWCVEFSAHETSIGLIVIVRPRRFSIFQVVSTYTNTGFSLVDQSMVPFQTAYPMIFFMVFLILAGNTAFVSSCFVCFLVEENDEMLTFLHCRCKPIL